MAEIRDALVSKSVCLLLDKYRSLGCLKVLAGCKRRFPGNDEMLDELLQRLEPQTPQAPLKELNDLELALVLVKLMAYPDVLPLAHDALLGEIVARDDISGSE